MSASFYPFLSPCLLVVSSPRHSSFTPSLAFLHLVSSLTSSQPCSDHLPGSAGTASFLPYQFWAHHPDWSLRPFDRGGEGKGMGQQEGGGEKGGQRRQHVLDWLCGFRSGPPGQPEGMPGWSASVLKRTLRPSHTAARRHVSTCSGSLHPFLSAPSIPM